VGHCGGACIVCRNLRGPRRSDFLRAPHKLQQLLYVTKKHVSVSIGDVAKRRGYMGAGKQSASEPNHD
jgi:hypothetical protein